MCDTIAAPAFLRNLDCKQTTLQPMTNRLLIKAKGAPPEKYAKPPSAKCHSAQLSGSQLNINGKKQISWRSSSSIQLKNKEGASTQTLNQRMNRVLPLKHPENGSGPQAQIEKNDLAPQDLQKIVEVPDPRFATVSPKNKCRLQT